MLWYITRGYILKGKVWMEGSLSKADENILVCLIIFALNPINNICDLKAANILPWRWKKQLVWCSLELNAVSGLRWRTWCTTGPMSLTTHPAPWLPSLEGLRGYTASHSHWVGEMTTPNNLITAVVENMPAWRQVSHQYSLDGDLRVNQADLKFYKQSHTDRLQS